MDINNYQDYTDNVSNIPAPEENTKKANGYQIASLVLGITGLVLICCGGILSIMLGTAGIVCAVIGNSKKGAVGIGVAGLVCSIISVVFGVLSIAAFILLMFI